MYEKDFFNHDKVNTTPEPETRESNWFSDDFETSFRRAVPRHRSLTVYRPRPKRFRKLFKSPVFAAVVSSLVTCCLCLGVFSAYYRPKTAGNVLPAPGEAYFAAGYGDYEQLATATNNGSFGIPEVYELVSPAVVSIVCKSQSDGYVQTQMSSGSGVILRSDGYIVTNNHVIDGASQITVTTIAGQNIVASVVGKDERTDLAVLKIESDAALPFVELGDSSKLRVGEMALAIGNPLREELAGTLTVGYISAINRSMVIDGKQMTMLQTDAAINPGNSGGALLNLRGQLIGINTAKSTGYDVEGLGFAIPINEAKPIIESIIAHGYVTGRVVIGISGQTITEAIAKANNLPVGVYVGSILEDSAAQKAGVRVGDVIIACDGQKVTTIDEINKIRDVHKVGEIMTMKVDRNGQTVELRLILQEEKPTTETEAPEIQQIPQQQTPQQIPFPFSWFGW
ncbi:MAG: trypsin-like peptidase domain-containing protein [Clostridia bacterium]|nr:trypsin-like peptidase domain-containing protein [Clostridia bacterium]